MNEALDLGLHAPVAELHFAQFVGAHDGNLAGVMANLLDPVVGQRASLSLHRLVQLGILLSQVLMRCNDIFHNVYGVWEREHIYSHCTSMSHKVAKHCNTKRVLCRNCFPIKYN